MEHYLQLGLWVRMDEVITFVYHHGGTLVTKDDGEVVYELGDITEQLNEEVDTLDVFAIRNYLKVIGYDQIAQCHWLVPSRPLNQGLRVLDIDDELLEMCFFSKRNERRIHIYYEHGVFVPNPVEECPKLIEFPPSTISVQVETLILVVVDVDLDSDVGLPPKSPPKTQPNSPKLDLEKEILPNLPKSTKTCKKQYTSRNANNSPTNFAPQNSDEPTARPNSDKPQTRSATRVSPGKGKKIVQTPISGDDGSSSSDSYDSVEDNLYMPKADELSSNDEDEDDFIVTQARKNDCKRKNGSHINLKKEREEIMVDDDGLIVDSDSDVDLGQVFGNETNVARDHDAYDADSDGKDSWESLEMKIPPNS
ncbi:hypothetical protein PIB30_073035 [Stylosanthes scabra]|uniref:PB1-like domain-containing protein n=1 Tax=Stylosanthes scabra TaxID=79078 RepID=A0ABU6RPV5_9FABA|nr:hypothetical protein [Stylosanthes scabra]